MLKSLAAELQFDYQLYIVPDGQFGAYDQDYGNWSGLVKELIDGKLYCTISLFQQIRPLEAHCIDCVYCNKVEVLADIQEDSIEDSHN